MSAKGDLLKKINKKAKKAKDLKETLKTQTNRRHIFAFFKEVEFLASKASLVENFYGMLVYALNALTAQLKSIDPTIKSVNIEWNADTEHPSLRGVTVIWPETSEYIDISEMLLI